MTKVEQMEELIKKYQEDQELQKEIAAVMQAEDPEDTTKADKWLADHGYEFTLMELVDHLEDASDLTVEELEAVAGGRSTGWSVFDEVVSGLLVGIGHKLGEDKCKRREGR